MHHRKHHCRRTCALLAGTLIVLSVGLALLIGGCGSSSSRTTITIGNEEAVALFPAKVDGKYGFIDKSGTMVIEPQYKVARDFSDGLAAVKLNDKWGYIDKSGATVIEPQFLDIGDFAGGLAPAVLKEVNTKLDQGFVDRLAEMSGNPVFSGMTAQRFIDGVVRMGLLPSGSVAGTEVSVSTLNKILTRVLGTSVELPAVSGSKAWGYIDKTGKTIIEPQFDFATPFSEGLAAVLSGPWDNWKAGYIDTTGNIVIEPQFDTNGVWYFSGGLAAVKLNDEWGFIDKSGNMVLGPRAGEARGFSDGLAAVKVDDVYGYIDKTGAVVITPQYEDAGQFSEGLAPIEVDGHWGYINKSGTKVIEAQFDSANKFSSGLALVELNGGSAYIDTSGRVVWQEP